MTMKTHILRASNPKGPRRPTKDHNLCLLALSTAIALIFAVVMTCIAVQNSTNADAWRDAYYGLLTNTTFTK